MGTMTNGVIGMANQLLADPNSGIRGNGYKVQWAKVPDIFRVGAFKVTVNGAVLADATSITVDALPGPLTAGTVLDFGGTGKTFARLTADAAKGATTIAVSALPANIADNAEAVVGGSGPKFLPAGTAVGKAGSTSGKEIYPRVVTSNPAFGLTIEDIFENNPVAGHTGHGVYEGGFFYENRLPDAVANGGTLPTAIKNELGARFVYKMAENNAPSLP